MNPAPHTRRKVEKAKMGNRIDRKANGPGIARHADSMAGDGIDLFGGVPDRRSEPAGGTGRAFPTSELRPGGVAGSPALGVNKEDTIS